MTKRSKPEAPLTAHAPAHDQEGSVAGIIDQIDGEAGDDGIEMMGMDAGAGNPPDAVPSRIPVPITAVIEQAEPIRIPSPESNPDRSKTPENPRLNRESNLEGLQSASGNGQFPLTRSTFTDRLIRRVGILWRNCATAADIPSRQPMPGQRGVRRCRAAQSRVEIAAVEGIARAA